MSRLAHFKDLWSNWLSSSVPQRDIESLEVRYFNRPLREIRTRGLQHNPSQTLRGNVPLILLWLT